MNWQLMLAGLLGFLGVLIGAFGAHGLEEFLAKQGVEELDIAKRIDQCDVAVRYHMLHTLALLILALLSPNSRSRNFAAVGFIAGIALFSGGLYSMVFLGIMGHWAIVPTGGLFFMLGWIGVFSMAFKHRAQHES